MFINNYFPTVIWSEEKPEFVKSLNKASNKYITDARKRNKEHIKKFSDFGTSHHSTQLTTDNDFLDFRNYIGQKSWEYLDHQGYDMSLYKIKNETRHQRCVARSRTISYEAKTRNINYISRLFRTRICSRFWH
jgi:hypothetical protein